MSIGKKMAQGALWMIAMRLAVRGIGVISTIVLARLLRPEDFGLVPFASVLLVAVEIFGQFGFDVALIREADAGRDHYDTVWTMSIARGLIVALVLASVAKPAGHFFGDDRVVPIIYCFSLGAALEGF